MISMTTRLKPLVETLNRFSGWLLLLTIGWLCWVAARLLWLLLAPPASPALPILPLQSNVAPAADHSSLFAIFADPAPVAAEVKPPPNVALKGVLLAIPESLSSALLDVNGEVKNYRIGDGLQDSGYTLIAVDWNAVIIADASDQQTVISMADSMVLDQRGMAAGAVGNQRLPDNNLSSTMPQALQELQNGQSMQMPAADMNTTTAEAAPSSPMSAIDEAVTALQDNPASYLSRMGVMASGDGYQVTSAMPAGLRNRLGLEPGDKVLSVNGSTVGNSPAQDAGLLQQVQQSGEAQIEVKRGDQTITIRQQF
jgi:general secretion pathway protein C